MPSFPATVFAPTTKTSGQVIQASHVNDIQDEVVAIESGYINGTARLNSSNSTLANLVVSGNSTLNNLSVTGNSTFSGTLQVLQLGVTNNFQSSNSTIANLSVTGNCTFAGTIQASQLGVTNNFQSSNSTILGGLSVTGGSTFASAVTISQLGVTNNFQSSNSTVLGGLQVTGGSTFASTDVVFAGPIRVDGAVGSSGSTGLSLGRASTGTGAFGSTAQVAWLRIKSGSGAGSTYWVPLFR